MKRIKELIEENRKMEVIINSTHDGLISINQQGEIELFNKAAEDIMNLKKESVLGKKVREAIPNTRLHIVLETGEPEINQIQHVGETTIITSRVPVRDNAANIIGVVAVFKDITEVKKLAEELTNLKEMRVMLEAIINSTQDAISVVDENGIGILINPAYTKLTGLSEKDVIGKLAYGVCYLVIIGIGINSFIIASQIGKEAINNMVSFMQALLPMLLTLLVSLGGVTASAVFHPVVLMAVSAVSTLIKDILIPVIFFSAVLTIVNNITNSFQLTRLSGLLKESCIAILGFLLSVFLGIMIIQGAAAAVVDGVSVRTAKFATKNFVPVVGGIFADAIDAIISCSLLLKNAIGAVGVIIVFIVCAFPVLKILSVIFIYKLAAALIQPIGDEQIVNSLNDLANSLIMLFVTVSSVAMMFFIAVTIIIGAGNITVMMR